MLYIHNLSDLNIKSAEIESVPFVRGIRQGVNFPLTRQNIEEHFAESLASENDVGLIERSIEPLELALAKLNELLSRNDPLYEPVNLSRAIQILKPLAMHLVNNLKYARDVLALQHEFVARAALLLNSIPSLHTSEEKSRINAELSAYFEHILRNKGFSFAYQDIVYEAQIIVAHDLVECFRKGYVFHVTLEEEIKKATFADIKSRIPVDRLREVKDIKRNISIVKEGIEQAYSLNMRMISWAIVLLSFIKWATSK